MTDNELTLDQLKDIQGGLIWLLLGACKSEKKKPAQAGCDSFLNTMGGSSVKGTNENLVKEGKEPHVHPTGLGSENGCNSTQVKDNCENLPF